jgi:hypothetical protein
METTVAQNDWSAILHDPNLNLLELRWLPTTSDVTDAAFMATLCLYVWEAETLRPTSLLIGALDFRHQFEGDLTEWRYANIIPRYGAAGCRKFAFEMPKGFPVEDKEEIEGPAVFPTKYFHDRGDALTWLAQP